MAHEFESGFFTKQPAWHGLGNVLDTAPVRMDEALEHSGLGWHVFQKPLFFVDGVPDEEYEVSTNYCALVRDKDSQVLGVSTNQYMPFQNQQAFEWCQSLVETEFWHYETAGSLRNGEECWILLKQDEHEIVKNDVLKQYLLFSWNHTGKKANTIRPVSIRVVCMNTLTAAMRGATNADRVIHFSSGRAKYDALASYYKQMTEQFARQHAVFDRLLFDMSQSDMEQYVNRLTPMVSDKGQELTGRALAIQAQRRDGLTRFVVDGEGSGTQKLGIAGSGYAAFMNAQEFFEHYESQRTGNRQHLVLQGKVANMVDNALSGVMAYAK